MWLQDMAGPIEFGRLRDASGSRLKSSHDEDLCSSTQLEVEDVAKLFRVALGDHLKQ